MKCTGVHRSSFGVVLAVLYCVATVSSQFHRDGFIDSDHDLLAMPSDVHERMGPITQYAFDNVPLESNQGQSQSVVPPPAGIPPNVLPPPPTNQQQVQGQNMYAQASSQQQFQSQGVILPHNQNHQHQRHHHGRMLPQEPLVQNNNQIQGQGQIQGEGSAIPAYQVDGFGQVVPVPVPVQAPLVTVGQPTTVYVADDQNALALGSGYLGLGIHSLHGLQDIVHEIIAHPAQAILYAKTLLSQIHIPKDHYLNVISFVGIYLFMSYIFYGQEDVLQLTCEVTGGNKKSVLKEYHYHAGRRFVPALPVDPKLQKKFLKLFKGLHLEGEGGSSSSEEISQINELFPKGAFFYSLSPVAIDATRQLQRIFVGLKGPEDVYVLAKDLLYHHKVNPKIWYLGLMAAALERPDMMGLAMALPLDAMPDWFIPAHLIKDEFDRYRSLTDEKLGRKERIKRAAAIDYLAGRNSTFARMLKSKTLTKAGKAGELIISLSNVTTTTTSERPMPDSAEISAEFVGLDGSIISANNGKNEKGESVEVDENQLQETMIRHGSVKLSRQDRDSKKQEQKNNKHKGKGQGGQGGGGGGGQGHKKGHKNKKHKHKKEEHCIVVDGRVGKDNGIENKLWYWREDLQLNQHHWFWHQTFPWNATRHADRRAELFFFSHRNLVARYNAERLSNGLHRTYTMDFPTGIVHEGYNSHLADLSSGKYWTPRPPKQPLIDTIHIHDPIFPQNILVPDLIQLHQRILKAIKLGKLITPTGKPVKIHNSQGIDVLANTVEATQISANPMFYDPFGIHNNAHIMIGFLADPLYKLKLPPGPMADSAMAMRDPAFYPIHTWVDNLFEKHKSLLAPYGILSGEFPLLWRGVEVQHVEVLSKGHAHVNELRTFWTDRKFELSPGVDRSVEIADEEQAKICAVHLAHEPFLFKIIVDRKPCARTKTGKATIRIFMAPRYDEKGRRFHYNEQRRLMFQLDAFQVKLRVGKNIITRRSHDSSLTKPWTPSLNEMITQGQDKSGAAQFCGCGYPQHLYIPKGDHHGMPFDLFVMATNYDEDKVVDNPKDLKFPEPCNSPYIMCSHPRRAYPDARPMGYPFDRPANKSPIPCKPGHSFGSMVCRAFNLVVLKEVETLEQFVSKAPNMKSTVFTIKHIDHFYKSQQNGWGQDQGGQQGGQGGQGGGQGGDDNSNSNEDEE